MCSNVHEISSPILNRIPPCSFFLQQQKQTQEKRMETLPFSIDLFLLQAKLLQALNERIAARLFVTYLFPKAKRSLRTFK